MEIKKCYGKLGCGKIKSISEFCFANKKTGRLSDQCKDCRNNNRRNETKRRKEESNKINGTTEGVTDKCNCCEIVNPINEFKKSSKKRGYDRICKSCYNKNNIIKYHDNIELSREKNKKYNKNRRLDQEIRIKENEKTKQFFIDNPEYRIEYERNKRKHDPLFVLRKDLRSRIKSALKNNQKSGSAVRDLGCSIEELKQHLEKLFYPNPETGEYMTWKNKGLYGWHIDHIKPLISFDLTNKEQFLEACHYTNLQPLWAKENLEKGDKLNWSKK